MRMLRSLFLVIAAAACVQTNAVRLGNAPRRAPVMADSVAVYRTADQVPGKYVEVALLNSKGESNMTNEAAMFQSMRKKAGELGANAIILDAIDEASAGAKVAGALFGTGTQRKGRSVAIFVFPDSTARSPR